MARGAGGRAIGKSVRIAACAVGCSLALPNLGGACTPHVEEQPGSRSASFRSSAPPSDACRVDEATYVRVMQEWLRARDGLAPVSSVALGRAVDYPWMSSHLADSALRSHAWTARLSRAAAGEQNRFVAALLSEPAFLQRLAAPFGAAGYVLSGVSVEKVLVGPARDHASDGRGGNARVPFDAQVWLRLARKP
jgi:hypothetical protein